jgi:hypothetical protein
MLDTLISTKIRKTLVEINRPSRLKTFGARADTNAMSRNARTRPLTAPLPADKFWCDLNDVEKRRQTPRVHANVPVTLDPGHGTSVEARTNDLSYHGMQVRCDKATAAILRPDSRGTKANPTYPATLQLDIDGISLRISADARIAHITLNSDDPPESAVAIGMTFVRFEDGAQEALHRFIDQHLMPADWS